MASREFTDAQDLRWTVWDVHPTLTQEHHRVAALGSKMAGGWLAFESADGERRRLAPVPELATAWHYASDQQLRLWLANADRVSPSRPLAR